MQSESAAQLVLQAVAPHTYGVHCVVAAEGQVPVPLQEPAGTAVPAAQLAARHWVETPGYPQAEALYSASACGYPGVSTQCRAASCAAGTAVPAGSCNGTGTCPSAATTQCTPYVCGPTACKTSCAGD